MKRGCLENLIFGVLLLVAFGLSTYFWFTFFVKGRSLPTPNLIGRTPADARAFCSDLGVVLKIEEQRQRNSDKVPVGRVVWQNPTPGATSLIKRGATVRVELSAGPLVLRVPDFAGQTPGTGMLRLGQQNLKFANLSYVDESVKGIVAADPPSGTVVAAQTPVSLLVAVPPNPLTFVMPDLIGKPIDSVRPVLESQGLTIGTVKYEAYSGIADGIIIRQYPLLGAPVSSKEPIAVVVSRKEETSAVGTPPAPPAAPVAPTTTQ